MPARLPTSQKIIGITKFENVTETLVNISKPGAFAGAKMLVQKMLVVQVGKFWGCWCMHQLYDANRSAFFFLQTILDESLSLGPRQADNTIRRSTKILIGFYCFS